MMDSVTLALESWLRHCLPAAGLYFGPLAAPPPDDLGESVVQAHLYDVREEDRSQSGHMRFRDENNVVVAHMQPVRTYQYSYQLSAHTPDWREGHALLGDVMRASAGTSVIPADLLHGDLRDSCPGGLPLFVAPADRVAFPWTGAYLPPSPVLSLVLMAPLVASPDTGVPQAPRRIDLGTAVTGRPSPAPRRSVRLPRNRIEE
ncbi:DUF4255 domain-containing protein [Streptomyces sp. SID685]|uniref:Pvc16 family protein n=1 Tax=Streptomyces TaxID=1883 RepID=UPI00136FB73D|nr:Pvc16 family protein [Streptomyces sp. SID685]MYR85290.1 DUF4255 domain-containing protein [Streptomyces sp. SID685]